MHACANSSTQSQACELTGAQARTGLERPSADVDPYPGPDDSCGIIGCWRVCERRCRVYGPSQTGTTGR